MFIPPVHAVLTWPFRIPIYPLALLPYYLTYLCTTSTASFVTPSSWSTQMQEYPYDRILFRPGQVCTTCRVVKPARSKHCRVCGHCIHRMDHHCIWVRNCLGRHNYAYFIGMLLSLSIMLTYAAYLGYRLLNATLQDATDAASGTRIPLGGGAAVLARTGARWAKGLTWTTWLDRWAWVFSAHIRVGATTLLSAMTAPLAGGLLAYHIYLIRRGTTTNESFKWDEWAEDVQDGYVYSCTALDYPRPEVGGCVKPPEGSEGWQATASGTHVLGHGGANGGPLGENDVKRFLARYAPHDLEPRTSWPVKPVQRLVSRANRMSLEAELLPGTSLGAEPWVKVESLEEVVNIYDLGWSANFRDAFGIK